MAKITKDIDLKGSRLKTDVLSRQTSLGEIDTSGIKQAESVQKLLGLTPEIAGVVSNAILLAKQQKQQNLENKLKQDAINKSVLKEDIKEGQLAFTQGKKPMEISNIDRRTAMRGARDTSTFNDVLLKSINDGELNNIENEAEFLNKRSEMLIDYTNGLVNDGSITADISLKNTYVLSQELSLQNYSKNQLNTWFKVKAADESYQTGQSLNNAVYSDLNRIKSLEKDEDIQNELGKMFVNSKNIFSKALDSNLSNNEVNDSVITTIDSMLNIAKAEDIPYIEMLIQATKTPYKTGKFADIDNDEVKDKNSLYTANLQKMSVIERKLNTLKNKKSSTDHYAVQQIKDNQKKDAYLHNDDGRKLLIDAMEKANTTAETSASILFKFDQDVTENNEHLSNASVFINGSDKEIENLNFSLDSKDKIYRDKSIEVMFSERTGKSVKDIQDFYKKDNVDAALEINSKFGSFPKSFQSIIDTGTGDLASKSADVLAATIGLKIADNWSKEDLAEQFNITLNDIDSLIAIDKINSSDDDADSRTLKKQELNKRKKFNTASNFKKALNENGHIDDFEDGIDDILDSIDIGEDSPYFEETKNKIGSLIRSSYMVDDDLSKALTEIKRTMQNEFVVINDTIIRSDRKIKEFGIPETEEILTSSLGNINDIMFQQRVVSDFDKVIDFFVPDVIEGIFTSDLNTSYDEVAKKHYISDGVGPISINYDTSVELRKSDNIEIKNGKIYINDITKPVVFKKDTTEKEVDYTFEKANKSPLMRKFEFAYNKTNLDKKFNFLIDGRNTTTEEKFPLNIDDLEDAIQKLNGYDTQNINDSDLKLLNAFASQVSNGIIRYSIEDWKKIK